MKNATLFENVRIRTLDEEMPEGCALLVCSGRIHTVYPESDPTVTGYGNLRRVDCQNLIMLPAFTDSHLHLMDTGEQLSTVDVSTAKNQAEAVEILKKNTKDLPAGEWIQGSRWGHNLWTPPSLPSKESLDAAFPHNPVYLFSKCGHLLWVNTPVLKAANISRNTPDPPDGEIERDPESGEPTGIIKEEAMEIVCRAIPEVPPHRKKEYLGNAAAHLNRFGIVNVHDSDVPEVFTLLQELQIEGDYPLNVVIYLPSSFLDSLVTARIRSGLGNDRLRFGGVKLFVDGSLGGRTAWLYEPHEGEPGNTGIPVITGEVLLDKVFQANRAGIVAMTHAIGDRANDLLMDVYSKVYKTLKPEERPALPNRAEHFQLLTDNLLDRIEGLPIAASMQPVHIFSDWSAANRFWGKRSRLAYACRSILDKGFPLVFGSDSPVEPVNPFWSMYAAVERKDLEGKPEEGWYSGESISTLQALRACSSTPPQIVGESGMKGTLTPGKRADFVLVDKDPLQEPSDSWRDARVMATAMEGEFVFREF